MSLRYFITDGHSLEAIGRALEAGVEMIQIREKHLSTAQLCTIVQSVMQLHNPHKSKILVNDRTDVALACGAHGVHLRSNSVSPATLRPILPPGFLIGVSCHIVHNVHNDAQSADFAVFGPVFETPGKGPAVGLRALAEAVHSTSISVLALGGITMDRIPDCLRAGAAGVAGIRLFQDFGK